MNLLIYLMIQGLTIYLYVIFAHVILSWLLAFGVVNLQNPIAFKISRFLDRVTDPVYRPIRRIMPDLGGIDLSPIVIIFGISLLQRLLASLIVV